MNKTEQMLFEFSRAAGVSGEEGDVLERIKSFLPAGCEAKTDNVGNLTVTVLQPKKGFPHLLLDAHIDEIGMVVTEITEEGFLRIAPCGGIDRKLLPAQEVVVCGEEPLRGVVCAVAPHLQGKKEQKSVPEWSDILIDIGFTKAEAEKRVSLGNRVTFMSDPVMLNKSMIAGKSMDNRAGAVAILLAAEKLKKADCQCGVSLLFSVEEEVSGKGASVGAFDILPDIAVSVDVSFAETTGIQDCLTGEFEKGPMIGISPTLTKWVSDKLAAVADENKIPYQYEVMGGATSTNADHLGITGRGIPTGLCSIPERYMHTPVETVAVSDIESTADLLAAFAMSLEQKRG